MRPPRAATAVFATLLALGLLPGAAAAHSELESSDPADGSTLATSPAGIVGDFSEELDPARSSMELRGPDGARIAAGGMPADGPPTRMTISGLAALPPGTYEVRWTTVTADDDGVERGTFSFSVAPAAPSASAPPAASPPPGPASGGGAADLLVPFLALGAVLLIGAAVLLRRRR